MNVLDFWQRRQELMNSVRRFFQHRGYLELDTPILVPAPGTETYLRYFETTWHDHGSFQEKLFLRSSPELHLKQAMAQGAAKVFQLAKCFRNQGELGDWHHPEFTMLEWYETGISYFNFMSQTEELIQTTLKDMSAHIAGSLKIPTPIPRVTVAEAFDKWARIKLEDEDPELAAKARAVGIEAVRADDDFETAFFKILLDRIDPALKQHPAMFLYDYPASQAALAVVEGDVAQRFELYVHGVELCNAFHECCDPAENRRRIIEGNRKRRLLGFEIPHEDHEFFQALEKGIPQSCGNALGFDRWLALLTGSFNLDSVIPFRFTGPFGRRRVPAV